MKAAIKLQGTWYTVEAKTVNGVMLIRNAQGHEYYYTLGSKPVALDGSPEL